MIVWKKPTRICDTRHIPIYTWYPYIHTINTYIGIMYYYKYGRRGHIRARVRVLSKNETRNYTAFKILKLPFYDRVITRGRNYRVYVYYILWSFKTLHASRLCICIGKSVLRRFAKQFKNINKLFMCVCVCVCVYVYLNWINLEHNTHPDARCRGIYYRHYIIDLVMIIIIRRRLLYSLYIHT